MLAWSWQIKANGLGGLETGDFMRNVLTTLTMCLAILAAPVAKADSTSLFTVGVGTSVGVSHHSQFQMDAKSNFTSDINVRLRMLHVLGFEFAYSPTDRIEDTSSLVFDSTFRMSAMLYVVPTSPVAAYIKAGIGGGSFSDVFSVTADSNTYFAGFGLDVHIGDHLVIGAEFLFVAPGVGSIRNTLQSYASSELNRFRLADSASNAAPAEPDVTDFLSFDNYRVGLNVHYYF
jgi:hypothetical protein